MRRHHRVRIRCDKIHPIYPRHRERRHQLRAHHIAPQAARHLGAEGCQRGFRPRQRGRRIGIGKQRQLRVDRKRHIQRVRHLHAVAQRAHILGRGGGQHQGFHLRRWQAGRRQWIQAHQARHRRSHRHVNNQGGGAHRRKAIGQAWPSGRKHLGRQADTLAQTVVALGVGAAGSRRQIRHRHRIGQDRQRLPDLPRQVAVTQRPIGIAHRRQVDELPARAGCNQPISRRRKIQTRRRLDQRAGRDQGRRRRSPRPGKAQGRSRRLGREAGNPHQLPQKIQHRRARKGHQILPRHIVDQAAHQGFPVGNQVNEQALYLRRVQGLAGRSLIGAHQLVGNCQRIIRHQFDQLTHRASPPPSPPAHRPDGTPRTP